MALSLFHLVAGSPPPNVLFIEHSEGVNPFLHLWEAVCVVETNNNPMAVNRKEQAYGIAQIRQIRLDDYAQRTGITYTLEDCFDTEVSKRIFMYYCNDIQSMERIARRWNGRGTKTTLYWEKVSRQMAKIETR